MKKTLKIIGITLGALIGIVLLVVGIVCHVILTPKRLTPLVNRVVDSVLLCEHQLDEVELTVLSTFPDVGLRLKGLYIINPMEGAQSDTVLAVPELIVGLDVKQALDGYIDISKLAIRDVEANLYMNRDGKTNFPAFHLPSDTTDTTSGSWTLKTIRFEDRLTADVSRLTLKDDRDSLPLMRLKAFLSLAQPDQAEGLVALVLDGSSLALEQFEIKLAGLVSTPSLALDTINTDVTIETGNWQISQLMAILPPQYASLWPKDIQADGLIRLQAHAYGLYDSLNLPTVDANLQLTNAKGRYKPLPYYIDALRGDIDLHLDLNQKNLTSARLNTLYAHTKHSSITVKGRATDILKNGEKFELSNPLCDLSAKVNLNLADADYFIHSDSVTNQLSGNAQGTLVLKSTLDDLTALKYERINAQADLNLSDLNLIWEDSLNVLADNMDTHIQIGGKNTPANSTIPAVELTFTMDELTARMDTIYAHLRVPKGKAALSPSRRAADKPRIEVALAANAMEATMGQTIAITTQRFDVEAKALYNKDADNVLLKWNPRLRFQLENGDVQYPKLGMPLDIPIIDFTYSNRIFKIDSSRIDLGNSDFSLSGEIHHVGKWLRNEGDLTGALTFNSEVTDVNQLMEIVNSLNTSKDTISSSPATTEPKQPETEKEPFMVPTHMDLGLVTHIRTAYFSNEVLEHLGGKLYVKDGKLVLEEMGFICEAARMQLTALYETPRRNHLYAGVDFHLIDIDIHNLIRMIPQVDSLVPMLSSFEGKAQFHLTLETYLTSQYKPKISTLRGACDIEGKDLVLLDNETFEKISKLLLFSPKQRNVVDSINCQMALYKDRLTVYPLCLSIDKYMAAVGGNHNLDMTFDYHASLLKPIWLGVDVSGNLDDLNIKLAPCRYMQDFRPIFHKDREGQSAELRRIIANTIKKDVKIQ